MTPSQLDDGAGRVETSDQLRRRLTKEIIRTARLPENEVSQNYRSAEAQLALFVKWSRTWAKDMAKIHS